MKKTIISILAIIILSGGAFAAKILILDKPADPQAFVNQALANSLTPNSGISSVNVDIEAEDVFDTNGKISFTLAGKFNKRQEYIPEIDYQISLAVNGDMMGEKGSIAASANLIILDEVFYGKFKQLSLTEAPPMIAAGLGAVNAFADKWYAFSLKNLKESDAEVQKFFEEQKQQQLAMRESFKEFLKKNNVLIVESLAPSFGSTQEITAKLNIELLTSDKFFTEIEQFFDEQLSENLENPLSEMDEAKKNETKETIRKILGKINPQITLQVGKKDNMLYGYDIVFDSNLADLEIDDLNSGSVKITIKSNMSEIDQVQKIKAPVEFEEIDPLKLMP